MCPYLNFFYWLQYVNTTFNTIMYDMYIYVFVRSFYLQCFNWLLCVKYITSLLFKTICRNTYIVKFIKLLLSYTKTEFEIDEFMYVYDMWKSRCITRCPIGIHGRRWSQYCLFSRQHQFSEEYDFKDAWQKSLIDM